MEKLLTVEETAGLLNVPVSSIYVWKCRKLIPYVKLRGLLRFRASEIENWVNNSGQIEAPKKKESISPKSDGNSINSKNKKSRKSPLEEIKQGMISCSERLPVSQERTGE